MEQLQVLLKKVHFAWLYLAGLWLLAFIAGMVAATRKYGPVFSYGPQPSHTAETFFILTVIVYFVGGFILGKLHNRHTANFQNASYDRERDGDKLEFFVTPAPRHLPFWLFGLFGAFFLFSLPPMLTGSGFGFVITLMLAGTFFLIGLRPSLWRSFQPHSFQVGPAKVEADGESAALQEIKGLVIGTSLRGKSDNANTSQGTVYYQTNPTVVYTTGNPLMAQGMAAAQQAGVAATAAAGQGIAEVANRYFYEMRARSYRVEAVKGGKNMILAQGLDLATAEALMAEVGQIMASHTAAVQRVRAGA